MSPHPARTGNPDPSASTGPAITGRGDVFGGVGGEQLGEQGGALGVGEAFSAAQQPAAVDPLDVSFAAASASLGQGDPPAHRVEHVVGLLDQMEPVDDQDRPR